MSSIHPPILAFRRRLACVRAIALVTALSIGCGALLPAPCFAAQKREPLPWTLRVDVRWGAKKNRETYRQGFARSLMERLGEERCFRKVVDGGSADLILDLQLNDFITEQEYATVSGLIPGQGEEHQLVAARASVDLDYWLAPWGRTDVDITNGHVFREIRREYDGPGDATEQRALKDLYKDASGWVTRTLCDQRDKLNKKISHDLAAPTAPTTAPDAVPSP